MSKSKAGSLKNDPLFQQQPALQFDNLEPEEAIELTDAQKAAGFISRYLDHLKEGDLYHKKLEPYFKGSVKDWGWELRDFKRFYVHLVVSGKWEEKKFITVLDSIISDNQILGDVVLDVRGKMYDQGRLEATGQSVPSRRRGRI
jgi:hypothetical protein